MPWLALAHTPIWTRELKGIYNNYISSGRATSWPSGRPTPRRSPKWWPSVNSCGRGSMFPEPSRSISRLTRTPSPSPDLPPRKDTSFNSFVIFLIVNPSGFQLLLDLKDISSRRTTNMTWTRHNFTRLSTYFRMWYQLMWISVMMMLYSQI